MQNSALGIRMHSGWGVLVAVSIEAGLVKLLERRRIVVTDAKVAGANQPYHHAAKLGFADPESYLATSAAISHQLAAAALDYVVRDLPTRGYSIAGCCILLAAGRPLPPLAKILASHPMIHTAEGEFFRTAARSACESLNITVTGIRERDLEQRAVAIFGGRAALIKMGIATLGKSVGPPWTKDYKNAALGAATLLRT